VDVVCGGRWGRGDEAPERALARDLEETTMTEYLITFNDEWVPDHTDRELREKAAAARVVLEEMQAADVLIFTNGGLDRSTAVCSVESVDGEPLFTDGPYIETKEHLGGFAVVDVPDDEAARYWAGRLAVALDWPQEVHRFRGAGHARRNGSAVSAEPA
jgi:hypothetical protein